MIFGTTQDALNFNPRSREGSDECRIELGMTVKISIHAPAKGATNQILTPNQGLIISIHAPAKGATQRENAS